MPVSIYTNNNHIGEISEKPAEYLGGETIAGNGASQSMTIPAGANCALVHSEAKAVHWEINPAGDASALSPGYVAADQTGTIPLISNFNSGKVFLEAAGWAHIEYFQA